MILHYEEKDFEKHFHNKRVSLTLGSIHKMRIPLSTYRVQFNPAFGFKKAQRIIEYLSELGISDFYASPIFSARPGSSHGYDVIDFNKINTEIGGEDGFEELIKEVHRYGLGWLQDFVPNHMAYASENQMLVDLLENGEASKFYDYFDIEWDHPSESIRGKILAPFLGEFYGTCLENGEIKLRYDQYGMAIEYYDLRLPLKIETYSSILIYNLTELKKKLKPNNPDFIKYLGVLYVLKSLPSSREEYKERWDQIRFIKIELWGLYVKDKKIKRFLDENIKTFNGEPGHPESFNLLDNLLSEQIFRLSFWKVATEEVNYRRFFTVNRLISLKMQDEKVFHDTHDLTIQLIKKGKITGLRIDHIDGLYDPTTYIKRLRERVGDIYITVEKILNLKEDLPDLWPIQGTTGYDFLNYVNELFCERKHERAFNRIYSKFLGRRLQYKDLVSIKKRLLIEKHMAGDVDRLARLMKKISGRDRHGTDLTQYGLKQALIEFLILFPVYRTYVSDEVFSKQDKVYISETIKKIKELNPGLLYEMNFIEKFLLFKFRDYISEEEKKEWIDFVMTVQQLTGPLMAKGFEDTTLYIYNRLISLNEVGGDPGIFGISVADFHDFHKKRIKLWPHAMNATSTHDTKRGEDVRARINVLSEIPEEWEENLKKWSRFNQRKKRITGGGKVPNKNDEYFLYQTLIAAFPFEKEQYDFFVERIKEYMIKAVREAKIHTAWIKPDTAYEERVISFIDKIFDKEEENRFLKDFIPFQKKVAHYGAFNSLSQLLLKITSPGVSDFYQGTELWDLNLVDPDNRRLVDFEKRKTYLQEIKEKEKEDNLNLISDLLLNKENGKIKLFLIHKALKAKTDRFLLFEKGDYLPLKVEGRYKDHVIAFSRKKDEYSSITLVPRFLTSLIGEEDFPLGESVWEDTKLSAPNDEGQWKDVFTGKMIESKDKDTILISQVLENFPVAFLLSSTDSVVMS